MIIGNNKCYIFFKNRCISCDLTLRYGSGMKSERFRSKISLDLLTSGITLDERVVCKEWVLVLGNIFYPH